MATRQVILTIFVLFMLLLFLLFPLSNGAVYRIHDLSFRNRQKDNNRMNKSEVMNFNKTSFSLLTKAVPIPPSGPSRRHNDHTDADGSGGSASASAKNGLRI
ncbi:hypothetical protein J1N35_043998 [Gossypium stocksii]|uniref:Uncharacterized protein n=1 Tax=Gossypium stocksii TaxID=47602 RepID=A0A9D3U8E1_9ROSI|nr:hypothetical protein J1N35_043998 [Gossypium stocksii]